MMGTAARSIATCFGGSSETWQGSRRRTLVADQMADRRFVVLAGVWFGGHLCVDHIRGSMPSAVVSHGPGKDRPYESGGAWAADRADTAPPDCVCEPRATCPARD